MSAKVDQIADRIYRISTFVPDLGPTGFTFNQFLVDAEEPLLYHTGMRQLFPLVSEAIEQVMPVERLRWIAFSHLEADECGAVDESLAAAPHAQVAHGSLGVMLSLQDQLPRQPRPLKDGDVLDIGGASEDAIAAEDLFHQTSLGPAVPATYRRLAALNPTRLAVMHGCAPVGVPAQPLPAHDAPVGASS
ncbi:MAG: hypothetical protein QOH68_3658 [Nocardioidaceae bacterium]|nr:hypothetical protein [Nocardioidaceae bacterium]